MEAIQPNVIKPEFPKPEPQKAARRRNPWKAFTALLMVFIILSFFTDGFSNFFDFGLSENEAAEKTVSFINNNLLQGQAVAELKEVAEDECFYNLKLNIRGQEINGYVTKDGALFFPQAIDLNTELVEENLSEEPAAPVPKSDRPKVELFVMSQCPYGTQAEKGIIPVVEKLGDQIDFGIRFVYYAMHGETEVTEQTNQYCIQKEQNDKFLPYLKCFLDKGESDSCLVQANIDQSKLKACYQKADQQFSITKNLQNQASWLSGRFPLFDIHKAENEKYSIGGSPTLVINGVQASSGRSPAEYLKAICAAFSQAPDECDTELAAAAYSPGFGYEAGANTAASCG